MFNAETVKNEIVAWIRQYFEDNGKDCTAVVGISGGKDSSVVAALCCEALGRERVYGVLMPQGVQPDMAASLLLAGHLGIRYSVINIGEAAEALLGAVKAALPEDNEQARINTPARVRMTVLYAVSSHVGGRVANTCNLSEDYVGYSTKFGDSAGDFSPISNLTVNEVKQIGASLGLPTELVNKAPADGLSGKTDEDNLGFTYDVLDAYIREGICDDPEVKNKIDRLHNMNLHKLKPMPSYRMSN